MYGTGWSETLKWVYDWNPRDQMKQATKYVNTALAGYVEYQYCLSCDGALSKRLQYNSSSQLTSEKRYEYDGINLLRVDERCDADGDGIVEEGETTWRMVEVATHRPGQLGALVGKRVYSYPSAGNRCVSNGYTVYTYGYDAVGNVVLVYTGGGDEAFFFAQDAFGNELEIAAFASSDWVDAREDGVGEHQTGKWVDPFTGQYYFHARWYDSVVGRFLSDDPNRLMNYPIVENLPTGTVDPTGLEACKNPKVFTKRIEAKLSTWGHQWIVAPGWSAGYYPDRARNPSWCPNYGLGGWKSPDISYHSTSCDEWWESDVLSDGELFQITKQGEPQKKPLKCCEATCSQIYACLDEAVKYGEPYYTFFPPFDTCRTRTEGILNLCCLNSGTKHKGARKGGVEPAGAP